MVQMRGNVYIEKVGQAGVFEQLNPEQSSQTL